MNTLLTYESSSPIAEYSKVEIEQLSTKQAEEIILSGAAEKSWAFLSKLEYLIAQTKERIKESAIAEIDKGNDFGFGVKMKVFERETPSYKNSTPWLKIDAARKDLEKFLKSLKDTVSVLDEDTGEVVLHEPPVISRSVYIKNDF
jgi:hypothetical protein